MVDQHEYQSKMAIMCNLIEEKFQNHERKFPKSRPKQTQIKNNHFEIVDFFHKKIFHFRMIYFFQGFLLIFTKMLQLLTQFNSKPFFDKSGKIFSHDVYDILQTKLLIAKQIFLV